MLGDVALDGPGSTGGSEEVKLAKEFGTTFVSNAVVGKQAKRQGERTCIYIHIHLYSTLPSQPTPQAVLQVPNN